MDGKILQVRHYGLNICGMELCEIVDVTGYLACRIAGRVILDENILGEALSRVEGLYKGIPHNVVGRMTACYLFFGERRLTFPKQNKRGKLGRSIALEPEGHVATERMFSMDPPCQMA